MQGGANLGAVGGGQGGGHLRHCQAGDRVGPVGGHVAERDENEGTVLQAGMRQDQPVRCKGALVVSGKVAPLAVGGRVGQDSFTEGDQVKVQRAHPPAGFAVAAIPVFDAVQQIENLLWAKVGGEGCRDCGIHIIGTGPCREARRCIYKAGDERAERCGKVIAGAAQGDFGRMPVLRQVCPERDEQSLAAVRHLGYTFV